MRQLAKSFRSAPSLGRRDVGILCISTTTERKRHGPLGPFYDTSYAAGLPIIKTVTNAQAEFGAKVCLKETVSADLAEALVGIGLWGWLVMRLSYTSNAIEGNPLTESEVAGILSSGMPARSKPLADQVDITSHAAGMEKMLQLTMRRTVATTPRQCTDVPALSARELRLLHAATIPSGKYNVPGVYRDSARAACSYDADGAPSLLQFPPPSIAAEETSELCQWLQTNEGRLHPLVTSAVCHYNLVRAHPFGDGNGRMGRMFMNCILLRSGYMPAIIQPERGAKEQYLRALYAADHERTLAPLVQVIGEGVMRSLHECSLE